MAEYTEEEVVAWQVRQKERWGIPIETIRAMNMAEIAHHVQYSPWSGSCLISRTISNMSKATPDERQTIGFESVLSMPPHQMMHLLLWGDGPCPEINSGAALNPDDYDVEPKELWGSIYDSTGVIKLSTLVHHAMYGWFAPCKTAARVRHIAEASLAERQTTLFNELHEITPAERVHLITWGTEPCPMEQ